jgi:PhnB protein
MAAFSDTMRRSIHKQGVDNDGKVHPGWLSRGYALSYSRLMVADASEQCQPTQAQLYVYVPNADATYQRAIAAGATSGMAPADMFYGDRNASVKDPSGNTWFIATHKEDVAPQELARRAEAFFKQQKGKAA